MEYYYFTASRVSAALKPVLGLFGPSRTETTCPARDNVCLIDAILARAFEIKLGLEATEVQSSVAALPQTLIDIIHPHVAECKSARCPVFEVCPSSRFSLIYLAETGRVPIDATNLNESQLNTLRRALADLNSPLTTFGRAYGNVKYAIFGPKGYVDVPDSSSMDIWTSIMSLLVELGVGNLKSRVEAAGLLVWDFVDCSIHKGIGAGMSFEPFETRCDCRDCRKLQMGVRICRFDEDVHQWWNTDNVPTIAKMGDVDDGLTSLLPVYEVVKEKVISSLFKFETIRRSANDILKKWGVTPTSLPLVSPVVLTRALSYAAQTFWSHLHILSMQHGKSGDCLDVSELFRLFFESPNPLPLRLALRVRFFSCIASGLEVDSSAVPFEKSLKPRAWTEAGELIEKTKRSTVHTQIDSDHIMNRRECPLIIVPVQSACAEPAEQTNLWIDTLLRTLVGKGLDQPTRVPAPIQKPVQVIRHDYSSNYGYH